VEGIRGAFSPIHIANISASAAKRGLDCFEKTARKQHVTEVSALYNALRRIMTFSVVEFNRTRSNEMPHGEHVERQLKAKGFVRSSSLAVIANRA